MMSLSRSSSRRDSVTGAQSHEGEGDLLNSYIYGWTNTSFHTLSGPSNKLEHK